MALNTAPSTSQSAPKPNGNGAPKEPTMAEVMAMMEKLKADNAALADKLAKASVVRSLSMKVSLKGAASLYGLGRFPITLYQEQWKRLLDAANVKDILDWLSDPVNAKQLKAKGEELDEETKQAIAERDAKFKAGK